MKIVKSNSGLGYGETAYFLHLNEDDYLCIDLDVSNETSRYRTSGYQIGFKYELLSYEIEDASDFNIKHSPLHGTFLFNYYMESINQS